jgi:NitT/TauT family transport system ATP-binding protein
MTILAPRPSVASPRTAPVVELGSVTKVHGHGPDSVVALQDISLTAAPGEFVCLLGASGCGKSTLLNLVAGFERPTSGVVSVGAHRPGEVDSPAEGGTELAGGATTAMLFQDANLFPWLTIAANVELPMRLRGVPKRERRAIALDLLERVRLGGFSTKHPHELSGGMRQRVALARALAQDAGLLLMDEPFGALDAITRDLLHDELEALWIERGFTVLFVTHNVREAARLGDRIVLLTSRPGRVAETWSVGIERPRRIDSPEIASIAATVTDRLRMEVSRHGH